MAGEEDVDRAVEAARGVINVVRADGPTTGG
jgi:hypothetical protein